MAQNTITMAEAIAPGSKETMVDFETPPISKDNVDDDFSAFVNFLESPTALVPPARKRDPHGEITANGARLVGHFLHPPSKDDDDDDDEPGPNPMDATESEIHLSREKAVNNLLEICAQNNINVNESLRHAILGDELCDEAENKAIRLETHNKRVSLLSELVRSRQEEHLLEEETELIKDLRSKMERLKRRDASFEVRIKDGSYKVETPVGSSGKAGVQHIATVTNAGCVNRMEQAVRSLLATGSCKQTTEEQTIMEGVNLVLEESKMYLVLGAPGCGKSTRKLFRLFRGNDNFRKIF